ncbi:hypothetical protein OU798_04300 [Prolixibacteraceae bacterium Z1-6]|uniref:Uncharacterized protein n=1 Tax=Draconibacterium aestuarii TaxID=2998507 RepID=A0A9X3J3N9_9BACT|nr:hypothetical protein [Prolixibacteraceae bacterium Z1-6]
MKKLLFIFAVVMVAGYANGGEVSANNIDAKTEIAVEKNGSRRLVKHPKKRPFNSVTVVREDYVQTHNPKRLHWNNIHYTNNPVSSEIKSYNPKRKALVIASEKGRTDAGIPNGTFVERKRKHL